MSETDLVAIIEGLPGCGKSYLCGKIDDLGYTTGDIDTFSQPLLQKGYADCSDFKKNMIAMVRKNIYEWLATNKGEKIVLCGVSEFLFESKVIILFLSIFFIAEIYFCNSNWSFFSFS